MPPLPDIRTIGIVHDDTGTGRPPTVLKRHDGWIYYLSAFGHGHVRCRVRQGTTDINNDTWQLSLPPGPEWYLPIEKMRTEAASVAHDRTHT